MIALQIVAIVVIAVALGALVWGAGIALLAWVTTRHALTASVLVRAAAGLGLTAVVYVVLVTLVGALLAA